MSMQKPISAPKKIREGFVGQKMIVLPPNIKKAVVLNTLINRFYITAIGYYPHAIHHNRERKTGCSQYIFIYCTEGRGTLFLRDTEYELYPNTFIIIPKNTPHHYKSSDTDPWSIYWVHFTGAQGDELYERYLERKLVVSPFPFNEDIIKDFDKIFGLLEHSFELKQLEVINIKALNFLASFVYFKETNPSLQGDNVTTASMAFMKMNLDKQYSLTELAKQQHLSVTQYARLFKHETGNSPIHYFNQLKIQKSCQYLYFTDRSIKEICAEFGFDDQYYFSRLFKKLMGISPAKYKDKHKKTAVSLQPGQK